MYRIGKEEMGAVARAINSRDFCKINGSGREAYHFEEEWKAYTGTAYTLLMSSGYAALTAAWIDLYGSATVPRPSHVSSDAFGSLMST